MMHGREKSDLAIGATKPANNDGRPSAELVERRAGAEGNAGQDRTRRAQNRVSVSQGLDRVRHVARQRKKERFTALLHHVTPNRLRTAFFALRRQAAPGVDGLTWQAYEADLDRRIEGLHERVHRGAYRALPARRGFIPKADGSQRPLAIAALEDKIVQRATAAVLNAIYEEDFLGFSYGFRPGRGAHDALAVGITSTKVSHILHQGEPHLGRRHPVVFRRGEPGMAPPFPEPADRRPAHPPPDPEMAERGGPGRRGQIG